MVGNSGKQGFRLPVRTARLVFEGVYQGAEVVTRLDVPLSLFFRLQAFDSTAELKQALLEFGAGVLVSWNLEDEEGQAVPAGADGMLAVPSDFARALIAEWTKAVAEPPVPLAVP